MSLSGSAKLVSKMGFLQNLTVVLILINTSKARTLPGSHKTLREIVPKNHSHGMKINPELSAERSQKRESFSGLPVRGDKIETVHPLVESVEYNTGAGDGANVLSIEPMMRDNANKPHVPDDSLEDIEKGLFPVKLEQPSEKELNLIVHTQQDENALHFLPTHQIDPKIFEKTMEQAEFEGKPPVRLLSPILIRGDSSEQVFAAKQDVYSSMKEVQPLQVQETLPSLSKEELKKNEFGRYPVESKHLKGIAPEYNQDSFRPLPAIKQEIEALQLSDCIKKLQSFFPNTLTNLGDVLQTHEHDTLPPLPNPMGDIKTEQLETFEKGNLGELHEPLPPTLNRVKLPDQSLIPIKDSPTISPVPVSAHVPSSQTSDVNVLAEAALPITEQHSPAPVVPSGPYPAEISILKEIPVALVAEPLPPLQNGVFTAKYSTALAPKAQLPGYFPMGSPYITSS